MVFFQLFVETIHHRPIWRRGLCFLHRMFCYFSVGSQWHCCSVRTGLSHARLCHLSVHFVAILDLFRQNHFYRTDWNYIFSLISWQKTYFTSFLILLTYCVMSLFAKSMNPVVYFHFFQVYFHQFVTFFIMPFGFSWSYLPIFPLWFWLDSHWFDFDLCIWYYLDFDFWHNSCFSSSKILDYRTGRRSFVLCVVSVMDSRI